MVNPRQYGTEPFVVAVIHGGPGAGGDMAPVARELSEVCGILEPIQTAQSIDGQVSELLSILQRHGRLPVTLIGHSWGAWLSYIFASRYPSHVRKLILVASGPIEEKYTVGARERRLARLSDEEKTRAYYLLETLYSSNDADKNPALGEFGALMAKADAFDPLPVSEGDGTGWRADIFTSVWTEAAALRKSGELISFGKQIRCPVVAIHGDYDPYTSEGVEEPLSQIIQEFRLILLTNCGHYPWQERLAREEFFKILKAEIA